MPGNAGDGYTSLGGRVRVFPFSYREYCVYTGREPGAASFGSYLTDGGFPAHLRERQHQVLQELLRDVVQRDVAARHGLRDTRHVMNVLLFLLANTGQAFSFQRLTKTLAVPAVAQTSRYVGLLEDAYLLFALPKFSPSFRQRVVAPAKYYAIDTGFRRANSRRPRRDLGRQLENAVALHLRRLDPGAGAGSPAYVGKRDLWECDFVTRDEAIQVCFELTPANRGRELGGVAEAARTLGGRRARVLTFDQTDRVREEGVEVEVLLAWRWMGRGLEGGANALSSVMGSSRMNGMKATRQLTAIIGREEDAYVALCPELDIASQGDTVEAARANLVEALELFFESADETEVARRLHTEVFVTRVEVPVA